MIIHSFSVAQPCEPPDDATKDRTSAVIGGRFLFFSKLRFALCRRIGPFNWRRSAAMVSAWLVLVARINKFPPAGTEMAMVFAD
jgi:hypothetical protein